jgi:hypothetical protein
LPLPIAPQCRHVRVRTSLVSMSLDVVDRHFHIIQT